MLKEDYPAIIDYPEDGNEEAVAIEDDSAIEDVSAPDWPIYLSLGAIAFTVLLILVINIASHRKK